MIFIFLINHFLACEFEFVYKQDIENLQFDIPQSDFTALGIWTRYYAFYLDISIKKELVYRRGFLYQYTIITGTSDDGDYLSYSLITRDNYLSHLLIIDRQYYIYMRLDPESYEGVWMFTYIGLDSYNKRVNTIFINTKTDQFQEEQKILEVRQVNSIKLFQEDQDQYPFSGQISFSYSQSQKVRFDDGEQLLVYLKSCNMENSCTLNSRYQILSGIMDKFNGPFKFIMQNNYWIDGWFKFTPNTQILNYNNLIVQIVQYDKEILKYNGIIPLKISLNFDITNLNNNGIIVETSSYKYPRWNDTDFNPIIVDIFDKSYLELLQNWVYFRFLQYEQIDHNAEFYVSFSDSSEVTKNMGQLNLFQQGYFFIYLGQSELNQNSFIGQLANLNIQSCLQTYPYIENSIFYFYEACHSMCFTCMGPTENNCLSCADQFQANRVLNQNTITCDCKAGFILDDKKVQCMEIQTYIKSATFQQQQIQQSQVQPCKDGQFQYQIEQVIKCYDCPQQSSSGILCADCLENLFTWQKTMKCSYDYYQENKNENNTYIKQQRPENQIEFYYIQEDKLQICLGCILDEGSYLIVKGTTFLYGKCHKNYYYKDQSCIPCQQNCEICEDLTGRCQKFYDQIFTNCPDYCVKCSQQTNNSFCEECLDGFAPMGGICQRCGPNCRLCDYDQNLNRSKCRVCKYSGYFLPFDGFDCVQNTIKNCLIQYQSFIQCVEDTDEGYIDIDEAKYNIKNTMGFEKNQPQDVVGEILTNNCALCETYYINYDTFCKFNDTLISDEQVIIKQNYNEICVRHIINNHKYDQFLNCWYQCSDGDEFGGDEFGGDEFGGDEFGGDEFDGDEFDEDQCEEEECEEDQRKEDQREEDQREEDQREEDQCKKDQCEQDEISTEIVPIQLLQSLNSQFSSCSIGFCTQCIKVQRSLKCIKCSLGFYEEILSGLCIFCPQQLNCQTCQQQNSKYKDGWKWSIRAFSNYQFESDLVSSNDTQQYEVICLTCLQGYMLYNDRCILNCPNNCNRCTIINGENVCTFCGSNNYQKLLTIQNNQCINCPSNCEFCRERSLTDVYAINSLFNPENPSKYYYSYICLKQKIDFSLFYNQVLQQYVKCEDGKFCMNQIFIKLKAHCDLDYYSIQKNQSANNEDFYNENIYIDSILPFSNIETPQFFEYLNGIQVESLIYELTLISPSNNCRISNVITTYTSKNVFSLTNTKLIINANDLTLNSLSGQIQNFTDVEIKQCKFNSPFYIKLYHPNALMVRLKDISFISAQINDIQIIIINPSTIEINNFFIQSLQQQNNSSNNLLSYEYSNTSNVKQLSFIMDNLSLVNGSFYNVDFFNLKADSRILQLMINISNSFIESLFYNSSFIKESSIANFGSIYLNNLTFKIQVEQASLINLNGQLNLSSQVKLIGNFTSSNFIRAQKLNIKNSLINNVSLKNSILIDNQILKQVYQSQIHEIYNLEFQQIQIDVSSNFITLIDKNGQDSLLIYNLSIIDCLFQYKKQTKSQLRLIMFEGSTFQLFNSLFQKNILGLTDISIKKCQSVIIDNVTVVGTNIQGLQQELDCYQELVAISQQNGFIEMENIQSVQVLNSQFTNIMIQDQPIIVIFCFDKSMEQLIQVKNLNFNNNLILKTVLSSQNALFQLLSLGAGNFQANNVSFNLNVQNQYQQTQFSNSATTLLIEADQFNITLNNAIFYKNQILNSSDSILYIKAKIVIIQNSIYNQTNIYDDFILRFVVWGLISQSNNFYQENLKEIFPILSEGGNANFIADQLFIQFCQFSHAIAQKGSGFQLTLQNYLSISDTSFLDLKNNVYNDESYGGSIFISLITLNATIEIINSTFENTSSLNEGGAIYINSRYTTSNVILSQITVLNCFSFRGSFISVYLNNQSIIKITNVNVRNSELGFREFLSQFQNLYDNQVQIFHQSAAIFYVQFGSLLIRNSIISDIQLSGVLYFSSASQSSIHDLTIQNIQFSSLGLIQIYPTSINAITVIQNVKILNCRNTQPQHKFCLVELINFESNLQCQSYDNKPQNLLPYPYDLQAKADCFYSKLLDFTTSSNMIYVDRIQITNHLYISDLNLRNNNCSFCNDGMIRVNNIDINTPEFNNVILRQMKFENNICGSGCFVISQEKDINFITRRLLQNLLYKERFNILFTVLLEQSEFFNNSAQNGILIVSNLSISIIDAVFIKNVGFDISGGILFLGNPNHTFQIMTSEFSDNSGNKGGALYLGNKTISSIELLQIILSSNQAKSFGQDIVSSPQELTISLDGGKTLQQTKYITKTPTIIQEIQIKPYRILGITKLQNFITLPSGYKIKNYQFYDEKQRQFIPYNLSLRIIALNNLKQSVLNLQNTICTIKQRKININSDNYGLFEEFASVVFSATSQDYNLDEQTINFDPYLPDNYVLQLQFVCSSVQIPIINSSSPYNFISFNNNYELRMNIRTFECQRGESYNEQLGTCNLCNASQQQYSVTIKASKCSVQDEITMISVKSALIELRKSYWRPYDDNNIVTQCYNFPINCNGGWGSGDESCVLGHIGALCEQCDLYNIRGSGSFARGVQLICNSCSDLSLNILYILLITLWTILSILISVKGNVENVDEQVNRIKGIKAGFVCIYVEKVKVSVLIKILTNYFQIISSIGTFQLNFSPEIRDIFTFSGNPIKSAIQSLDCFIVQLSNIEILYFRNLWLLFMPIYYSNLIFIIYFILIQLKYLEFKITVLWTTLIFIFIYVQPDIIGSFVSLLSFRNISEVLWVQGDVSYLYSTSTHTRWLLFFVIPILLVVGFLIPIFLYKKLYQYKDKLNDISVLRIYGYLYNEYSKGTYYWEIIKIYQKELIIIFLTFYEDTIIIKGTLVFMIIFQYDIFSKRYKPYKRADLNTLDSQSSNVCVFSIVLGMAIHFTEKNGNLEILWLFFLCMAIFNFYFILRLITLIIKCYLDKFTDQLNQIRDYINNKYPYLVVKYPVLLKYLENSKIRSKRVQQRFIQLRKYLWKIVEENRNTKRFEIKESQYKLDSNNQILRDYSNQSVLQQLSNQKLNDSSNILLQDIDQKQINNSLDIQNQNNIQASDQQIYKDKSDQNNIQDEQIKQNSNSYDPQSLDFYFIPSEQDIQNNKEDELQQNFSFQ